MMVDQMQLEDIAPQNMPGPTERLGRKKVGWRVREWAEAVGLCRATVYNLIVRGAIDSGTVGRARIIRTSPDDFLDSHR